MADFTGEEKMNLKIPYIAEGCKIFLPNTGNKLQHYTPLETKRPKYCCPLLLSKISYLIFS